MLLGFWDNFLTTLTGRRSNCWVCLSVLIGSGNLYHVCIAQ